LSTIFLDTPIEYLKGVGPQKADTLKKEIQVFTFGDLLTYFPYRYIDKTKFHTIAEIQGDENFVQIKGSIISVEMLGKERGKRMVATLKDETGTLELVWFKGIKWIASSIKLHEKIIVFGRPSVFNKSIQISHPELEPINVNVQVQLSKFEPMYNSSEKMKLKGLDSKGISKAIKNLLEHTQFSVDDTFPQTLIQKHRFIPLKEAYQFIHFPQTIEQKQKAEFRLKFEELFFIQLKILQSKLFRKINTQGFSFSIVGNCFNEFYNNHLPFELTNAQKRVIKEIRFDMGSGKQMNRLLQGDVGSGKTLVALMCMLIAKDNNFQSCLMAPTEILAQQHYQTFKEILKNMNVSIELLTGSTKQSERKRIFESLANGNLDIIIETHALIEEKVVFKNLGLVVIDEQHRFGVEQRSKLWKKNILHPHILVMTATPIPRTLAMTFYGDLDTSIIDELPKGRKPILTSHRYDSSRLQVFGFMAEQIRLGRQVYIVYPLIQESENSDYKDLMDGYESIVRAFPRPQFQVSIVHGKMKPKDKDFEMQQFASGKSQILVATTVIEVGVNVPNASVMIIESAERFGLSQLHQLRGRVGRGAEQSYCILLTGFKLSEEGKKRIETMVRTNDGFEIADVDMKLRGPGDIAGTRQSGVVDLKISDLAKDGQIVMLARDEAHLILEEDPQLYLPQHIPLQIQLAKNIQGKSVWSKIS
jgi:ATP-dependent DNA helicase RecG